MTKGEGCDVRGSMNPERLSMGEVYLTKQKGSGGL